MVEVLRVLERVDELRIETRSHLNTHTTEEQPDVHDTQIGLLVPWRLILLDEASDDGVRGATNVDHVGELALLSLSSGFVQGARLQSSRGNQAGEMGNEKENFNGALQIILYMSFSPACARR